MRRPGVWLLSQQYMVSSGQASCDSRRASPQPPLPLPAHLQAHVHTLTAAGTGLKDLATHFRVDAAEPVSEHRDRSGTQTDPITTGLQHKNKSPIPTPRQGSQGESMGLRGTSRTFKSGVACHGCSPSSLNQPSRGGSSKRHSTYFLTSRTHHLGPQLGR